MPIQAPQWTEFLVCPVCTKEFNEDPRPPVSLGCGHTICRLCLSKLSKQQCPYDQTEVKTLIKDLPVNYSLLQLLIQGYNCPSVVEIQDEDVKLNQDNFDYARTCIEDLALYLLPLTALVINPANGSGKNGMINSNIGNSGNGTLTKPMQRKMVTLVSCQLVEEEGRCRAMRSARSLGERAVKELILLHQNPQHLSANLWASVRNRGCQFLGPAMQEEVLKLILLALEDGNSLSRKVLVLFVVQRLEPKFSQASKTSIGHVVQLLYRASCFKVTKREGDSSLLQLHEKFRTYTALRKEHDAQIVQIAMEAGLHISPEQWSALLYGDDEHKSHMQSIIDKLQTPASFGSSIQELIIALQRTQDPADLQRLRVHLERLATIDPSSEGPPPSWEELKDVMSSLKVVVEGLVDFVQNHSGKLKGSMESQQTPNSKYKTSMCRDIQQRNSCPRGPQCSFAHSPDELERFRKKRNASHQLIAIGLNRSGSSISPETVNSPNSLENSINSSRDSPDEIVRNGSLHSGSDLMQGTYYRSNGGGYVGSTTPVVNGTHVQNGAHVANGSQMTNGTNMANGSPMMNGHQVVNGNQISNGSHLANGTNGSRVTNGTHIANGGPLKNGAHMVSPAGISNGYQRINYQRPPVIQTDGSMNAVPVTYLQSPVPQVPARSIYVSNGEQRLDLYPYPHNQATYIQPGVPFFQNDTPLLQLSRTYQPYMQPQFIPYCATVADRGTKEKDRDETELERNLEFKKSCVSRSILSDSMCDELKLDSGLTSRTSSSLFSGKGDSIWRDANEKARGPGSGSGLDTSSEYSSETFSPLSTDSSGSPQPSQTYANPWKKFEANHPALNDSHEFSPQPSMRKQNSFSSSRIWSQSSDDDTPLSYLTQNMKLQQYNTDWDRRHQSPIYKGLMLHEDEDKGLTLNHSADTQSSFEEASSEDLYSGRYEWSNRVNAPPGLQPQQKHQPQPQQAPIGTKSSGASGKARPYWDFSRQGGLWP
ncbi:roquin-1-like [Rhopilema esculentum]|uniref:roquin-1-like n=1 Tax=Rhopilema esculentum TaxID=499914 RepID=UPI0031E42F75